MMQEQVVIAPITITKTGQIKHFQIKLPKTAKRIIGVEIGGRLLVGNKEKDITPIPILEVAVKNGEEMISILPPIAVAMPEIAELISAERATAFKRNTFIGELKLQSCEEANIFYAGHLQTDNNLGYGDFSQNRFWKINPFTHQAMAFEETVIVDADSTIIQGVYKDSIGKQRQQDVNYLVNVYVWYQR